MQGESKAGVAAVRPPGHHAESYESCGFCHFNTISIAAKYALGSYSLKRILILDWDVHHGNGTQRIFLSDPQVLYISIHRFDRGTFFPNSKDAAANVVGSGAGVGFNVNIPWNQKGMGNAEYITSFLQVVLPIAYQFAPELVLVSAGFDAVVGDPIGGCNVSPETYGLLTSWLAPLAMGRIIICLEGGYNLTSTAYAMTMCTKALLGDPMPPVYSALPIKASAAADLKTVLNIQAKYWSSLRFNKELPKENVLCEASTNKASSAVNDELLQKMCSLEIGDISNNIKNAPTNNIPSKGLATGDRVTKVPNRGDENDKSKTSTTDNSQMPGPSGSKPAEPANTTGHLLRILINSDEMDELGLDESHAVHPSFDCPHLSAVAPLPTSGIDITSPCVECLSNPCATQENWICLTCYSVHCGRVVNEHMMLHSAELSHPIVLGFRDLSVWCYSCDCYIESEVLYEAKNAVHMSKFNEPMPNIFKRS